MCPVVEAADYILLHPMDNLIVACRQLRAGQTINLDGVMITLQEDIPIGHKIARNSIKTGDKILKYGVSIGSAVADIEIGRHIHLHNMKSDYIASHTRDAVNT